MKPTNIGPIIVVDDDPNHLRAMTIMLSIMSIGPVYGFTSAPEAMESSAFVRPALVVSDWNMAPMDGLQFLIETRRRHQPRRVPFVLVTANLDPSYQRSAAVAGADGLVLKPLALPEFRATVLGVLIGSLEIDNSNDGAYSSRRSA